MNMNASNASSTIFASDIILGTILAPFFLALYSFVLFIIIYEWKHFRNPYYATTVGLGFCHLVMLIRFIYTFVISYHRAYVMGQTFDSFMATLAWSIGWHSALTYQIVLAVNRFVAIIFYDKYRLIFTRRLTIAVVIFAYISGLLTVCPLLIRHKMKFDFDRRMNILEPNDNVTKTFYSLDLVFACLTGSTVLLLYATSIGVTKYKLQHLTVSSSSNRSGFIKEVKMMVQGFLVALSLVIQEVNFYLDWNAVVTLTFMLLHAGMTPLIYLALDEKLRKYFCAYIRCQFKRDFKTDSVLQHRTIIIGNEDAKGQLV